MSADRRTDRRTIRLSVVPSSRRQGEAWHYGARVRTFNVDSYGWRLVVERYRNARKRGATVQTMRGLVYFTLDASES